MPASLLQCPYLCVKRLILEQQCWVEVVPCVAAPCREMKSTVNVLFPPTTPVYHGTFSTLIKKPVFTLNAACGCHSFLAAALKGAIEFPTNKQVRPRGFPRGSPQLWWLGYLPGTVRKTQIFTAITWMKAREKGGRGSRGVEWKELHPHERTEREGCDG